MHKTIKYAVASLAIILSGHATSHAAGTVVLSNLQQDLDRDQTFGDYVDGVQMVGQSFTTGTSVLILDSVVFLMTPDLDTPEAPVVISIYTSVYNSENDWFQPDALVLTLSPSNSSPSPSGPTEYTFTANGGLTLSASTRYWIVATSTATQGAYNIGLAGSTTLDVAANNWTVDMVGSTVAGYEEDYGGWYAVAGGTPMMFSITAVPEPSTYILVLAGMGVAAFAWRRNRRVAKSVGV